MKKKISIFLAFLACGAITAHEFWLEPRQFNIKKGETLTLKFLVGENFEGDNWSGDRASADKLNLYYDHIQDDLTRLIPDSIKGDSLKLQFFDEGTAVIAYQSTNKYITLEPAKFMEYLKEDGIRNAIQYREEHGETDSAGREQYMRCAKTVFQVGKIMDESYKKVCGLPVEFIPLVNPYSLKKGDEMKIKLQYMAAPLGGAVVKIWHRVNGITEKKELITNENGEILFPVSLIGKWMVSTVRMDRTMNNEKADWQSYWASLTWGY
jgi:uncharacterized GH25 family protein